MRVYLTYFENMALELHKSMCNIESTYNTKGNVDTNDVNTTQKIKKKCDGVSKLYHMELLGKKLVIPMISEVINDCV